MAKRLKLQIIDESGSVMQFPAGGALEVDLVAKLASALIDRRVQAVIGDAMLRKRLQEALVSTVVLKGVGYFRSEARVKAVLETSLAEVFRGFYDDTRQETLVLVEEGIQAVFDALKKQTVQIA